MTENQSQHVVAVREHGATIAAKYGVLERTLLAENGLYRWGEAKVGEVLMIPTKTRSIAEDRMLLLSKRNPARHAALVAQQREEQAADA